MIRPSASAVERQLACPGSAHLPQAPYNSEYADQGTDRHEDVEVAALLGDLDGLPWQIRKLLEPGDVLTTEVAMAYDVSLDTARALGHIAWRDYRDLTPFEIPMTLDLVIHGDRRILLIDHKGFEQVTPAATNPQLATGALALARASGRDEITVAIVYLGAAWLPADVATLSALDFDMHASRLRDMMTSGDRTLNVGKWCKYCHAFLSCPEQAKLGKSAGGGELAMRVETMIPFANDEDALAAYELINRIGILYDRLKAALHARAADRPIPLGSGRMFGRIAKQGNEKLDGNTVHAVVKELHGLAAADAACPRTATKKAFVAALTGKRGAVPKVLKEVRARGGSERKAGYEITEYDAGPRLVSDPEPEQLPAPAADSPF